jgi:succinyl-diaminopimelate desuccinylase
MNPAEEKSISAEAREVVELTKELIRFQSTRSNPDEILRCARFIENWLESRDITCTFTQSNGTPSIIAVPAGRRTPLLLMSHIDVVSAEPELFEPVEKDGRLFGRGAIDDKYAAALSLVLLKNRIEKNRQQGIEDDRPPPGVLITGDEETGGMDGAHHSLGKIDCDFCIALDGGRVDKIVVKEKGVLQLKIVATGQTAHGARPWLGENAIERLIEDIRIVQGFFADETAPDHWHRTANLSVIKAGKSFNQVPDKAEALFDIRYTENDDVDDLIARIQARLSGRVIVQAREPMFNSPDSPHLDRLLKLAPDTRTGFAHGASDARFLSEFDIAGIVWGADGNNSQHAKDEHVEIQSIARLYDILDQLIEDLQENPIER